MCQAYEAEAQMVTRMEQDYGRCSLGHLRWYDGMCMQGALCPENDRLFTVEEVNAVSHNSHRIENERKMAGKKQVVKYHIKAGTYLHYNPLGKDDITYTVSRQAERDLTYTEEDRIDGPFTLPMNGVGGYYKFKIPRPERTPWIMVHETKMGITYDWVDE